MEATLASDWNISTAGTPATPKQLFLFGSLLTRPNKKGTLKKDRGPSREWSSAKDVILFAVSAAAPVTPAD